MLKKERNQDARKRNMAHSKWGRKFLTKMGKGLAPYLATQSRT